MLYPRVQFLELPTIERILDEAYQLLRDPGVIFATERPLRLLAETGADVDLPRKLVRFPAGLIDQARATTPSEITLYDSHGSARLRLHGDEVYYYPASTAMSIWDADANRLRSPMTPDLVKFIKVAEGLPYCHAQSSTFFCNDVPRQVADSYRIYLLLKLANKPFVTGAYSVEGQQVEIDLLEAVRGGADALAEKPLAVMTACPSPPLKWSLTAEFVIMSAEAMLPMAIGPMPLAGANGPVTLIGTIVQYAAESLSGLVLAQAARPGAPIFWMSPTAIFDMKNGTTPLGAIETHMIACGINEVGKYLNLPTVNYLGISDAKTVDAQFAMESTAGILLALLSRSNLHGGLGMLNFESAQSLEGLVISHEAAGMAHRLGRGIDDSMTSLGLDIIREVGHSGNFLETEHTLEWFRKEFYFPGIIDRRPADAWLADGAKDMLQRARERVDELLARYEPSPLPAGIEQEINAIMLRAATRHGMNRLPRLGA